MARLVLVHGFTQTGRSFGPLLSTLGAGHQVSTPDLPGHGRRPEPATDLLAAADQLGRAGGPATDVGYSLGGRVALHLALARPDLVERLVLVSTTAGIDREADRAARRTADDALADWLELQGVERFLERWLAQPLFAGLAPDAAGLEARRENTAAGLAAALRRLGAGTQEPLWDRLVALDMPVLVVAGRRDTHYCELARRLVAAIGPNATLAVIPDAGHACHLEHPATFAALISQSTTA
ncbi:MAG: alpha/beta fold hydrolase [Acidimicrobiales bacterium]